MCHFNKLNVGNGYGSYCCGVVSSLICASSYDLVDYNNFLSNAYKLIDVMKTSKSNQNPGTTPSNMINGFNKFFNSLVMKEEPFTEKKVAKNIKNEVSMVGNLITNYHEHVDKKKINFEL